MSIEAEPNPQQSSEDESHLNLLSVFHWVIAGLAALTGFFPIIHVVVGIFALVGGTIGNVPEPEARLLTAGVGAMFIVIGLMIMAISWTMAFCLYLTGSYLKAHTNHTFCLVISAIICLSFPLGTLLGVFTIIVLMRPSVKRLFGVT